MHGDDHPTKVLVRSTREHVLDTLSDAFRRDEIGLEEFEHRVDRAYAAATPSELLALVEDVTHSSKASDSSRALAVAAAPLAVSAAAAAPRRGPVAILGNVERRGHFALEGRSRALAILGNVELDLREVSFPPGVTELFVRAVLGNVEIVVPPQLAVECEGRALLGSFSEVNRVPAEGAANAAVLRVIGSAVLGNVEIQTRPVAAPGAVGLLGGARRQDP